jgi:predicted  nucleic acid-binding Zn-ribbon protein
VAPAHKAALQAHQKSLRAQYGIGTAVVSDNRNLASNEKAAVAQANSKKGEVAAAIGEKKPMEQLNLIKASKPGTYKVPLNPVIDKRTVKQKLSDAQTRRSN